MTGVLPGSDCGLVLPWKLRFALRNAQVMSNVRLL